MTECNTWIKITQVTAGRKLITQVYAADILEQEIIRHSSHRSEHDVRKYQIPDDEMLKTVSKTIDPL